MNKIKDILRHLLFLILLLQKAPVASYGAQYRQLFSGLPDNYTIYIFADMPQSYPQLSLNALPYGYYFMMPVWNDNFKDDHPGYVYGSTISENENIVKLYSNGQAGNPVYLVYTQYGHTKLHLWAGTATNNYVYNHNLNVEVIATKLEPFKTLNSLQDQTKLRCNEGLIVTYKDDHQAFIQTNYSDMNAVGLHIVLKDERYRSSFNKLKVGDVLYGELSGKMTRKGDGTGTSGTNYGCELEFIYYNERKDWNSGDLHNQPLPLTKVSIRQLEERQTTGQYKWDLDGCRVMLSDIQSADNHQLGSDGYMKSTGFSIVDTDKGLSVGGKPLACNLFTEQSGIMASQRVPMDAVCYPVWQGDQVANSNYARLAFYLPGQDNIYGQMKIYAHGYITFALDQPFQLPASATPSGADDNNAKVEYAATIGSADGGLTFSRIYKTGDGHAIPKDEAVLIKAADDISYSDHVAVLRFRFAQSDRQPLPCQDAGQGVNLLHWGQPGMKTTTGNAVYDKRCKFYHLAANDYTDPTSPVNFYYATSSPNGEPFTMPVTNRTSAFLAVPQNKASMAKSVIRIGEFSVETGINQTPCIMPSADKGIKYYDISGRAIAKPQHGINIIRRSDGKSGKVILP